jgi:4,5-dihydroxyphthalate decarboxylase
MKFALLARPRTHAIFDGAVTFAGLPIDWRAVTAPLNWQPLADKPGGGMLSAGFDGGEMSISSFLQAKSRGAPLVALPIFLKRGLVQRCLYCAADSPLRFPEELGGRRVGLVGYASSMAIWVRGVLAEEYSVPRSSIAWFAVTPSLQRTKISPTVLAVPDGFVAEDIKAWEELDGYPHKLDRHECFLLSLLENRQLDAVISFHPGIASSKIRPLVASENDLWSHYQRSGIYPINHLFVLRKELLPQFPDIAEVLMASFKQARTHWREYLRDEEREAMDKEMARLRSDPFAYRLTEGETKTLETFIGYLHEEDLVPKNVSSDQLFL